jgi:hypothetical protein
MTREGHVAEEDHRTHKDPGGFTINLDKLEYYLGKLGPAADYLAEKLQKLSEIKSYDMNILVGDGSPDQSAGRHDFAKVWNATAEHLLTDRTKLTETVKSFVAAMTDVYQTYSDAEGGNVDHFQSLTYR